MLKVKKFLSQYGIHTFLLPVFFVLHTYLQYYGLISSSVSLVVLARIEFIFFIFFLILFIITRNANRSLQITTYGGFICLFFGPFKDFLDSIHSFHFISKYSVLLPVLFFISLIMLVLILKKIKFSKSNLYQNILLLILIFVDTIPLLFSENPFFIKNNLLVDNNIIDIHKLPVAAQKPDVYYLLFDCYPETQFLHDTLQYDNSSLDIALQNKGFHIIPHPVSNYNRTAFSMSATLNFEYLKNINGITPVKPKDYNQARLSVQYSSVPEIFEHYGYAIYNLSIFDLKNHPAIYKEKFLALPQKQMLLYNTLTERIKTDILWKFFEKKETEKFLKQFRKSTQQALINEELKKRDFNNIIIDSLKKLPDEKLTQPKFIYAHFYLPHPPFFYDKNGKPNDLNFIVNQKSIIDKPLFFSYLEYTNKIMLEEVDKILAAQIKNTVIIIQSDHGYGDFANGADTHPYFKNYTAFYFPDKNYSMLKDSMSNINTFPILFNKYFKTNINMQKDSTFFLPFN